MARDDTDWTEELITKLRQLWSEGYSTAEIGRRMTLSKNAVVAKAHRLNLPPRPSPIRRDGEKQEAKPRAPRRVTGPTLPALASVQAGSMPPPLAALPEPPAPSHESPALALVEASPPPRPRPDPDSRFACCWPIGQPGTKGFAFCGEHVAAGRPYCPEHQAIATVAPRDLVRETVPLATIEAYAQAHRVVVKIATGLSGLIVAVNNHRRAAGLTPYALKAKAAA